MNVDFDYKLEHTDFGVTNLIAEFCFGWMLELGKIQPHQYSDQSIMA